MKKFKNIILYGLLSFSPLLALAQSGNLNGVGDLANTIKNIISNNILPLLFAVAILYFFWGLIKFIGAAGDPEKSKEGKQIMIWGIIALAVMVSLYGIIAWLGNIFNVGQGGSGAGKLPTI